MNNKYIEEIYNIIAQYQNSKRLINQMPNTPVYDEVMSDMRKIHLYLGELSNHVDKLENIESRLDNIDTKIYGIVEEMQKYN